MLKALLWDVDGTLAETERDGHRVAFNLAFEAFDLPWRWDEARYEELLRVAGGRERILHDMATRSDAPLLHGERLQLAQALHTKKNALYAELVRSGTIQLRDGVLDLMRECTTRGVLLAITTTTSRSNLDALMRVQLGDRWAAQFAVIVCGEDVQRKKPDPEVYLRALEALEIGPLEAVAVEDSPGGVAAARAAGIPVVVTLSACFADATIEEAIAIGPGFHQRRGWRPSLPRAERDEVERAAGDRADGPVRLDDIEHWRHRMEFVSQFPVPVYPAPQRNTHASNLVRRS